MYADDSVKYYQDDIAPIFASANCATGKCHGAKLGAGGLKLAIFNGSDKDDFETIANSYNSRYVNKSSPKNSLLLKKLSGEIYHKGTTFAPDSKELKDIETWIKSGAQFQKQNSPTLVSIELSEKDLTLKKGDKLSIKVIAKYSDGSQKDISDIASLKSKNRKVSISKDKKIKFANFGTDTLSASFQHKFVSIPVICSRGEIKDFPQNSSDNKIDELVLVNLKKAGIKPAPVCTDSEFLRRLYIDATGLLPSAKDSEAFLKDPTPNKRQLLIEKVLASPQFVDMLTMRFADLLRIKSEFPSNLWPNAAVAYHTWLRDSIASEKPYDVIARDMLLSSGSNFKVPPSNFYRAVGSKNAEGFSEAAALVFMGVRTNCIKCHAHPNEAWTNADNQNFSALFNHLSFKKSKEWKEEILTLDIPDFTNGAHDQTFNIFGEKIESKASSDPREAFVDWLLDKNNPYFAKAAVSRIWFWIFSKGLIEPADDIRPNNVSANVEILNYLEGEFKNSNFNLKQVYRLIFNSQTYQRSYIFDETNKDDNVLFSRHIPVRISAESLNDILSSSFGVYQPFKSITPEPYAFWPENYLSIKLHDGSVANPFLTLFGKPGRNSSYLNDRSDKISMQQLLHLLGSTNILQKLNESKFIKELAKPKYSNDEKIKTLYLTFLCRMPTAKESEIAKNALKSGKAPVEALKDLAWAIINTKEFLYKL